MLDLPYAVLLLPLILLLLAIPTYLLLLRRPSYDPLADEFSHTSAATSPTCTIKALYIYPIKSCRGAPLRTSIVLSTGLSDDRQFLFAERDPSGQWHFITQRRHYPQLTHVVPTLDHVAERMHVSFPGSRRGFSVGLRQEGPVERVHIWKDEPEAYLVAGGEVVEGLKKFLGAKGELALFRVCQKREVFRCAPRRGEGIDYQPVVGFADAYPLHVVNLASVRDLNARLEKDIPKLSVERFRANIILSGPPAFDEDDWLRFEVGGDEYYAACRTVRCTMPNVDPETAVRHPAEPDRTLRSYRCIDGGAKNNACLGLQVVPRREEGGVLSVGDVVNVLERGEHFYICQ